MYDGVVAASVLVRFEEGVFGVLRAALGPVDLICRALSHTLSNTVPFLSSPIYLQFVKAGGSAGDFLVAMFDQQISAVQEQAHTCFDKEFAQQNYSWTGL